MKIKIIIYYELMENATAHKRHKLPKSICTVWTEIKKSEEKNKKIILMEGKKSIS